MIIGTIQEVHEQAGEPEVFCLLLLRNSKVYYGYLEESGHVRIASAYRWFGVNSDLTQTPTRTWIRGHQSGYFLLSERVVFLDFSGGKQQKDYLTEVIKEIVG